MKTVLITGGSSGIGYELAKIFGQNNYNLILVARNRDQLKITEENLKSKGFEVTTISKDLSLPSSPKEIYDHLQKNKLEIDVLINNAGFGTYGPFIENDLETELKEVQVNITALTHLTKLFARDMVKKGEGKILNVASTAAFAPGPLMTVYYASKAYVLSFSEALAEELSGSGISVSVLCPGPTDTGFIKRGSVWKSKLFLGKHMSAAFVAQKAYEGLMNNQTIIVPSIKDQIMIQTLRFLPKSIIPKIVKSFQSQI